LRKPAFGAAIAACQLRWCEKLLHHAAPHTILRVSRAGIMTSSMRIRTSSTPGAILVTLFCLQIPAQKPCIERAMGNKWVSPGIMGGH
jgi:hypothetical protein